MKTIKTCIFLLLFLCSSQFAFSHDHGNHQHENKNIRTWYDTNNTKLAKGSFLLQRGNDIIIETQKGNQLAFPISSLSKKDFSYFTLKNIQINKVNSVNASNIENTRNIISRNKYSFLLFSCFLLVISFILYKNKDKKLSKSFSKMTSIIGIFILVVACSKDDSILVETIEELIESTSDPLILKEAFDVYPNVSTSWDDNFFYVSSNGIPEHQMMVGITAWIAQVPLPHPYTGANAWSIPLKTVYAETPISINDNFQRGAIAIASNGIPIFNPLNASGLVSKDIGELDQFGGHSGKGDDYHYHIAPLHLQSTSDLKPIAYALDGFAVYGSLEPDGSTMNTLDDYHGHEYSDGTYHYHGTDTFPYMIGAMRGLVTLEGTAPQNQVTPQPSASPPRTGDPHPINGANLEITDLTQNSNLNGYVLDYTIGGVAGSVDYSWDSNGEYTYIFNDVNGTTTTEVFQGTSPEFSATSIAVANGELLADYKCETKTNDIEKSIPISWSNIPEGTKKLAVTMHHYPNPNDTTQANSYLALWDIDPTVTSIPYGGAGDGNWFIGSNKDGTAISYTSPCSPSAAVHEYVITVYALSETPASLPTQDSLNVDFDAIVSSLSTVNVLGKATLTFNDVTK